MSNFAETYGAYSDDELVRLFDDIASLTEEAKVALRSEIQKRGLTPEQLADHSRKQAEYTAQIDNQRRDERRALGWTIGRRFLIRLGLGLLGGLAAATWKIFHEYEGNQNSSITNR